VPLAFASVEGMAEDRPVADMDNLAWYGVRCFFEWRGPGKKRRRAYEERITLWQASGFDEAISKAAAEARAYVNEDGYTGPGPVRQLALVQAYLMNEDSAPGEGVEVFSMLRESDKTPKRYLTRYFDTGRENSGELQVPL